MSDIDHPNGPSFEPLGGRNNTMSDDTPWIPADPSRASEWVRSRLRIVAAVKAAEEGTQA